MCTVTFMPTKNNGFILTSNRDENAKRSPQNITRILKVQQELVFPRDIEAGGSWIAASSDNKLVCLLNGAFERQERNPPYRISRGIMVLDFFQFLNANEFFTDYSFEKIEPFTMIICDNGQLWDFRWDGIQKHVKELDTTKHHIWSSATLYDEPIRLKREKWLDEWLKDRTDFSKEAILELHKRGGEGNPSIDFMMNRWNHLVETVSITQVIGDYDTMQMIYHDLINKDVKEETVYL